MIGAQHFVYLGKLAEVKAVFRALRVGYAQFRETRGWALESHRAVAEAAADVFVGVGDIAVGVHQEAVIGGTYRWVNGFQFYVKWVAES